MVGWCWLGGRVVFIMRCRLSDDGLLGLIATLRWKRCNGHTRGYRHCLVVMAALSNTSTRHVAWMF